jgi:hypothetical protein
VLDEKLVEYLRSAADYCDPHPGLTKAQLLLEMERARLTIQYVIDKSAHPAVASSSPRGQAET